MAKSPVMRLPNDSAVTAIAQAELSITELTSIADKIHRQLADIHAKAEDLDDYLALKFIARKTESIAYTADLTAKSLWSLFRVTQNNTRYERKRALEQDNMPE